MIIDEVDEFIKEFFDSLNNRNQNKLKSMTGSEFVFDFFLTHCIISVIK